MGVFNEPVSGGDGGGMGTSESSGRYDERRAWSDEEGVNTGDVRGGPKGREGLWGGGAKAE